MCIELRFTVGLSEAVAQMLRRRDHSSRPKAPVLLCMAVLEALLLQACQGLGPRVAQELLEICEREWDRACKA